MLKGTIAHEYGHSTIDRILDPNGNFVGWKYPKFNAKSVLLQTDGPIGYGSEILNAGRFHIARKFLISENPLWSEWNSQWGSRFIHALPRRFDNKYVPFIF